MSTRKNGSHEEKWELRLYTAGQTPKSLAAIKNLRKVCDEHLAGRYEIEIVDLLKNRDVPYIFDLKPTERYFDSEAELPLSKSTSLGRERQVSNEGR